MTDAPRYASKLAAALDLAKHGFPVFPIVPDGKTPLIENWQNLATTDLAQIAQVWNRAPDANIGIATANYLVLDVDTRKGGHNTLAALELTEDFPDTIEAITQSGGMHRIYALPARTVVGNRVNVFPGIDIRSYGGLIVAPGSTIEARAYRWAEGASPNDRAIATAPQWLIDKCRAPKPKSQNAGERVVEADDTAFHAALDYVEKKAQPADAGARNDAAFKVAAQLFDYGVSQPDAVELLNWWNGLKCHPPLEQSEIEHVVTSAMTYRGKAIGSNHPNAPGFEVYEHPSIPQQQARGGTFFTPLAPFDAKKLPLRPWVIDTFACRGRITMLAGPGGVAKSTYTIMLAVALAAGRSDICGFPITTPQRVAIWNQEDDLDEMQRRIAAVMKKFDVQWEELEDENGKPMLCVNSGVDSPFYLGRRTPDGLIVPGKDIASAVAAIKELDVALLILDPLIEMHEAPENDNALMRQVMSNARNIAVQGACAVLIATHTKKPPQASSDGFAGEMDAARGASSQFGVVRIGETLFSASPKDAKEWRFDGSHLDYVRLDSAKNNLAARRPHPIWFKREQVLIGAAGDEDGGEKVGVLRPVDVKRKEIEIESDLLEIIARTIDEDDDLGMGRWFKTAVIVEKMAPADAAVFPAAKNRGRLLDEAFDGADQYATNRGVLRRITKTGPGGSLYLLESPQSPQNHIEEILS
jgi:hypothetical protein